MCDPITMITGGTALLSAAMGAAQQAVDVTQQLRHAAGQRNDFNFLADQQRNAASVDEMRAQQAEQAGEADADTARQKAAQRLGQLLARLAAQGTDLAGSPIDLLGGRRRRRGGRRGVAALRRAAQRLRVRGASHRLLWAGGWRSAARSIPVPSLRRSD